MLERAEAWVRCGGCGWRLFQNVAAAAAVLLVDPEGRLLWVRRGIDPGRGLLGLPGGFIDAGESGEAAAARELHEETGVRLAADTLRFLMSVPNRYPFDGLIYPTLDLYFTAALPADVSAAVPADPEVTGLVWRSPASLRREELAFEAGWVALQAYRDAAEAGVNLSRPGSD